MPKVSVLMPVYNSDQTVARAIESILGQSFSDFELIIIDDASTDETFNVLQKYQKHQNLSHAKQPLYKYYQQLNQ